jgi:hypothetical protein
MRSLLGQILLAVFIGSVAIPSALAQKVTEPVDVNARDPRLQEGKLFTLKIVPQGKSLEVEIAGKKAGELHLDELGVSARLFVGQRPIELTPRRTSLKPLKFRIDSIDESSGKLQIELKSKAGQETFEVESLK